MADHRNDRRPDRDDGGPAFARPGATWMEPDGPHNNRPASGMTLRDYFAAAALSAMNVPDDTDGQICQAFAMAAYQMADAMINARRA